MSDSLNPEDKKLLRALCGTFKKDGSVYIDLFKVFPDAHPKSLAASVTRLESLHLLHSLDGVEKDHLLCRVTDEGDGLFNFFDLHRRSLIGFGAGFALLMLVLGFSGALPQGLTGDVTGTGLTAGTQAILTDWIANAEQENSDHYTFSLLEKAGDRKTYLVECKTDYLYECKYKIVFVELDERSGTVLNVELPHNLSL